MSYDKELRLVTWSEVAPATSTVKCPAWVLAITPEFVKSVWTFKTSGKKVLA